MWENYDTTSGLWKLLYRLCEKTMTLSFVVFFSCFPRQTWPWAHFGGGDIHRTFCLTSAHWKPCPQCTLLCLILQADILTFLRAVSSTQAYQASTFLTRIVSLCELQSGPKVYNFRMNGIFAINWYLLKRRLQPSLFGFFFLVKCIVQFPILFQRMITKLCCKLQRCFL